MKLVIYLQKKDLNDATSFYTQTIQEAVSRSGITCERVYNLRFIRPDDTVLVIQAKAFFLVWLRNRKQRIITWFQGVSPEESDMIYAKKISRLPRKWIWRFLEKNAIKNALFVFFVSRAMTEHYRLKYGYDKQNNLVMPCFNLKQDRAAFFVNDKYTKPSFVYAGGILAWQCIEPTLELFKVVQRSIPEATLTILTSHQDLAHKMVRNHEIKNCEIKYVQSSEVGMELAKYKYGFLLREDNVVNNVATPTKMNSYMASGIIPICTDVIDAFKFEFSDMRHTIRLKNLTDHLRNAEQIVSFESKSIDPSCIFAEYETCFDGYYNQEKYIQQIQKTLHPLLHLR